ncbi:unnamed protein product [Cylicocyclus nassatus]|uniref:Uncharacterized protein n=1 Tax=Cylicocyclus nassatus TaxID=53992 RepID=A0AA36H7J4_CYLNA|nr:unnamed protein product [Cylicocyclus nassatus]
MSRILLLVPILLLSSKGVLPLGGKLFFTHPRSNLINKSYAYLTLCQPSEKIILNVSVVVNPFQEGQVIHFQRAGVPFEVNSSLPNVTHLTVAAAPWPIPLNLKQITLRLGKNLYKLLLNPNCEEGDEFWISSEMTSYWSRFVDCEETDTYCDSRSDEISACETPFTYHMLWSSGIDRYE